MPILQNKLVMKSIEALHNEALSQAPDTTSDSSVTVSTPPAIVHATTSTHQSSANAPSTDGEDIMARIDNLLRKLDDDDDDVAITSTPFNGPETNTSGAADHASDRTKSHAPISDNTIPSTGTDIDSLNELQDNTPNDKADSIKTDHRVADHPTETGSADRDESLAKIAAAIYQARQQVVDTVVTDAGQSPATPFDMDAFSAIVADEVRSTVLAVMAAELPKMVCDAVNEAIRALPEDTSHRLHPTSGKASVEKAGAKRKTSTRKKSVTKKMASKKPIAKKATAKKPARKKTTKSS